MTEDVKTLSDNELEELYFLVKTEYDKRASQNIEKTAEITLYFNSYKGTGKAWIQRIENGVRTSFVDPVRTDKNGYKGTKVYRLVAGRYLVNDEGTKRYDDRREIIVKDDLTIEKAEAEV